MTTTRTTVKYNAKDLILYSLGIGCCHDIDKDKEETDQQRQSSNSSDSSNSSERKFVYEQDEKFRAFPLFPLCLPFRGNGSDSNGIIPFSTKSVTPALFHNSDAIVLHVAQSLRIYQALPVPYLRRGEDSLVKLHLTSRTLNVVKKSIGTFITTETDWHDDRSMLMCTGQSTVLLLKPINKRAASSLTNTSTNVHKLQIKKKTTRTPDKIITLKIVENQALLYRLSGDYNPIHVEAPTLSTPVLPTKAILHGLCTLGIATRAILSHLEKRDSNNVAFIAAKFSHPVPIGGTIQILIWEGAKYGIFDRVIFQVRDRIETHVILLDGGILDFKPQEGKQAEKRPFSKL